MDASSPIFSPLVSDVSFHSGVEVSGPWPDGGPVGSFQASPIFEVCFFTSCFSPLVSDVSFHSGVEVSGPWPAGGPGGPLLLPKFGKN